MKKIFSPLQFKPSTAVLEQKFLTHSKKKDTFYRNFWQIANTTQVTECNWIIFSTELKILLLQLENPS